MVDKKQRVEDGVSQGPSAVEPLVSGGAEGVRKHLKAYGIE